MNRGACLLVAFAACSGPPVAPVARRPAPATEVLPEVPFAQLDHAQRLRFMKERVVPAMRPVFQRHDAERFSDFGCATCHGEAAKTGSFALPSPELPRLELGRLDAHEPEDVAWMKSEVLPEMARLLGVAPRALGCAGCHPIVDRARDPE